MTLASLIDKLKSAGIRLRATGDNLEISGAKDRLTRELIAALTRHKSALLELMQQPLSMPLQHAIQPAPASEYYALSHAQMRIWVNSKIGKRPSDYNCPMTFTLNGILNRDAIEGAFDKIIERHEILRTVFTEIEGMPKQRIVHREQYGFYVKFAEGDESAESVADWLKREAEEPFSLQRGPLMRVSIISSGEERHVIVFVIHHIICDGWSLSVLIREFTELYDHLSRKKFVDLAPLTLQYKDFAAWQNRLIQENAFEKERNYWREHLRHVPAMPWPREVNQKDEHGLSNAVFFSILKNEADLLQQVAADLGTTPFAFLLAILNVFLYKTTHQSDIVIGTPVNERPFPELDDQIGLYLNTLPIRSVIEPKARFCDLLLSINTCITRAYRNQHYPYDLMVEDLVSEGGKTERELFSVGFTWNEFNDLFSNKDLDGVEHSSLDSGLRTVKADLWLFGGRSDDGIRMCFCYRASLFSDETITLWSAKYGLLIREALRNPSSRIDDLKCMLEIEQQLASANKVTIEFGF